jgi:hypothetical protein
MPGRIPGTEDKTAELLEKNTTLKELMERREK